LAGAVYGVSVQPTSQTPANVAGASETPHEKGPAALASGERARVRSGVSRRNVFAARGPISTNVSVSSFSAMGEMQNSASVSSDPNVDEPARVRPEPDANSAASSSAAASEARNVAGRD
jgi:hypothetical protein